MYDYKIVVDYKYTDTYKQPDYVKDKYPTKYFKIYGNMNPKEVKDRYGEDWEEEDLWN